MLTLDNKTYEFKVVESTSGRYSSPNSYGFSMYVPPGFLLLKNAETGRQSLECCGAVLGQYHFDITWLLPVAQ